LVVSPSGDTRFLAGTGGAPLATGGSFPLGTARLAPGELLLLYSDGILERPGRTHPSGAAELATVAASCAAGRAFVDPDLSVAERVCVQTVEMLVRTTGHHDDITLLAAQRVPVVADLDFDLPPEPAALSGARETIGAWLTAAGATAQDAFLVQHALGELMTNSIEHAASIVAVSGWLTPIGEVAFSVRDQGAWQTPTVSPTRGRGLAMAAQLVDSLKVTRSEAGTTAWVRHTLMRPARLLDLPSPSAPVPDSPFRIAEEPGGDEARVRIEGAIDAVTAGSTRTELLRRGRGGTVPLYVDLSGVTHLSSAGVSALHHVAARHLEQNAPITLLASDGAPARVILDLVGLPRGPVLSTGLRELSVDLSTIAG
jgi:anti-sigma regulatory factor (Ser/Thr protein kinase)/anti-anti-sigma regulatory factor